MYAKFNLENDTYRNWEELSYFPPYIFGQDIITRFNAIFNYGVIPVISVMGISGNVMSMVVLYRHGLDKCSNILIFALAAADSMYLVGINNIPLFLYYTTDHFGYFFAEALAATVFTLFLIFVLLETVGKVVSMTLPALIIVERFTAVFLPLLFTTVMTPRRVKAAVVLLYPLGLTSYLFYVSTLQYAYVLDTSLNSTVGYILKSESYSTSYPIFGTSTQVFTSFCGPFCVGFVLVGCVLISVKVQIQLQVRKRMTFAEGEKKALPPATTQKPSCPHASKINGRVHTSRTTKILLSVCFVYTITGSFNFLSDMVFNMEKLGFITGFIIHRSGILFLCINSTANFIIYVAFNKNFRQTYKQIFLRCSQNRSKQ